MFLDLIIISEAFQSKSKMQKYIFTLLFLNTVMLSGCEKDANVNVPIVNPKLVVQSYISPQDTLLKVYVSKTTPVFSKKYFDQNGSLIDQITNAAVTLSNGNKSIKLEYGEFNKFPQYYENGFAYLADAKLFPIVAGESYTLKVSTPDGMQAEATCTVPQYVPDIPNLKLDSVLINDTYNRGFKYFEYSITFSIKDIPSIPNYYKVAGDVVYSRFNEYDGEYYEEISPIYFIENDILTDQSKDGGDIIVKGQLPFYHTSEGVQPRPYTIRASVLNVDQHYFKYHQTIRATGSDNPFQEPVIMYSNITGGLGVFGAFNKTSADFIFE